MAEKMNQSAGNAKLQAEIDAKLNQHRMPKYEQKARTRIEKMTLVMSWFMVVLMVGGIFYAAANALGWF